MKNKRISLYVLVIFMVAASVFVIPKIDSYGASKYHNYSPDKKGTTTATINLRSGSNTKNKKLTTIPKGKTITLYGYDEVPGYNWYKTKYNGKTGYVRRDNVKIKTSSSASSKKYHNYSPDKKGKTTATINMRSGSSTKNKKVTTIPKGKTITLYGYDEVPGYNWYKTKYNGKTGYVRRDNVKVTSSSSSAASKITISGATKPTTITEGKNFSIKGTLKSTYKMTEVKVGIMKISTGKFYSNYVGTAKPNATTYNIHKLDNKVSFGKAQPGTYYYTVQAKDSKGKTVNVIKQKFTVKAKATSSKITISGETRPTVISQGQNFSIKGKLKSTYDMKEAKVGIMKISTGTFYPSFTGVAKPNNTNYDIHNLDEDVPFGKAQPGTYYYTVQAKDSKGKTVNVVKQKFTVKATNDVPTDSAGKKLKYNSTIFQNIGKQPYSGPCGLYAMAYGRLVLDGAFPIKSGYDSVCEQLQNEYGMGSNAAHWDQADSESVWTNTVKQAYQGVLKEINAGRPCIIPVDNPASGNNHFITVIGYKAGTTASNVNLSSFIFLDPTYCKEVSNNAYKYTDTTNGSRYIRFYN